MGKYKKVYVAAPYNYATGGVELAHQLVDYLRDKNQEAYIVYLDGDTLVPNVEVTKVYQKYNISVADCIEDSFENIYILPEVYLEQIYKYKYIQIGCWWMSVDNHYRLTSFMDMISFKKKIIDKIRCVKLYIYGALRNKISIEELRNQEYRVWHFYQSHYAQNHLYNKGLTKVMPLSDYINTAFLEMNSKNRTTKRENIVLYNPAKGYLFTKKIIAAMPEYEFIALKGLNRDELKDLFLRAKLYIDFGNFPGKDRLPREAVINGCCIVTGKLGAAFFYEDLPIPIDCKFEVKESQIPFIRKKIIDILNNYEDNYSKYSYFLHTIYNEQQIFNEEIESIFL